MSSPDFNPSPSTRYTAIVNRPDHDPGTHNFELDNRTAFYRVIAEEFFPGDAAFSTREIPAEGEVKSAAALEVALPGGNLDFSKLATSHAQNLPRDPDLAKREPAAARRRLAAIVKYQPCTVAAARTGGETRDGVRATFWKLRVAGTWTVPVVELVRGEPKGTTLLVADGGRASAAAQAGALLAGGQRVLALDPFYFGESKIPGRDYLFALLVAAVGERPLGLQASQVAAIARWAGGEFRGVTVALQSVGPRSGTFALVAAALEPGAIAALTLTQPPESLRALIAPGAVVNTRPEQYCFGLLEAFDIPQLKQLVGAERLR